MSNEKTKPIQVQYNINMSTICDQYKEDFHICIFK